MSITPAPANHPFGGGGRPDSVSIMEGHRSSMDGNMIKSSCRRKQSFPTKTTKEEAMDRSDSPCQDVETDDYLPDFTGNNPWCNIQMCKNNKVSKIDKTFEHFYIHGLSKLNHQVFSVNSNFIKNCLINNLRIFFLINYSRSK